MLDRTRLASFAITGLAVLAGSPACSTNDLVAPNCYNVGDDEVPRCAITGADTADGGTPDPSALTVDCSEAPRAASLAEYAFTPTLAGGEAPYVWSAEDLPEGLVLDAATGTVSGTPRVDGDASFVLTVRDAAGATAETPCELTIAPALALDHAALLVDPPFCITGDATLLDHVVPGTGDDTPITCATPNGTGNGRVPEGLTVDPDTCAVTGTPSEPRFGTTVFLVRGRQSGRDVWAPYCVTDPDPGENRYGIEVAHSGLASDEGTLVPLVLRYDPEEVFAVGGAGDETDPLFIVTDPSVCVGGSCFFGYLFGINASLFDGDTFSVEPTEFVRDDDDAVLGFSHRLFIEGPPRQTDAETLAAYAERPWALVIDFAYCLSETREECDTDVIRENGGGALRFSVIAFAE